MKKITEIMEQSSSKEMKEAQQPLYTEPDLEDVIKEDSCFKKKSFIILIACIIIVIIIATILIILFVVDGKKEENTRKTDEKMGEEEEKDEKKYSFKAIYEVKSNNENVNLINQLPYNESMVKK